MNNKKNTKIKKALQEVQQAFKTDIARRHILHFRIDQQNILALYEMAASKKQPLGTMIREWVIERLHQEQNPTNDKMQDYEKRLKAIEKRLLKNK